ncbi:MaoC family dehydratase N-terminal domain-containing protein [Nonomuraea sp. NPDC050783]|uniref:FAS1-like dehydratase domain-containing protein n=1 Tax=Nonomuraea sp. NPDC050783 TaxID=3154634 RepID=UPI003466CDCA
MSTLSPALAEVLARAGELAGRWEDEDCGVVTAKEFRRYAAAVNDTAYLRDARAAEAAGRPVTAPPLFLTGVMSWEDGPVEDELRPDGLAVRESPCTRGLPVRQVHGGQTVRLGGPLVAGTHVRALRAVCSAAPKRGRSGNFVVLGVTTRFIDEDGTDLASVDETIIVMDLP